MAWEYFQISGVQNTDVQKIPHRLREATCFPKHYFLSSRERGNYEKSSFAQYVLL